MRAARVRSVVLRQAYLMQGSWARVTPLFAWVSVNMFMWGFTSRYLDSITASSHHLVPTLLGATLLWNYFDRVLHGVTTAFFEDIWSRNLINLFASPLTITEYLAGLVITAFVSSSLGLLLMTAIGTWGFGLTLPADVLALGACFGILLTFGISLGIVGCALVLHLGPAAEWLIWPIPAFLTPFVGVYYPQSTLPPWMQAVAGLLPPTSVFETLRAFLHGRAWSGSALAWGGVLALCYLLAACAAFRAVHTHAMESGLLARHSAEGTT